MTLELVRRTTGSTKFYEMVRNWAKANQDGVVSTDQFMRTAATVANKNLDSLFQDWLFTETKPTRTRY
jgi:predicted DNA-binding WGR domain protein